MDEVMKEDLNKMIERMTAYIARGKRQSIDSPLQSRISGFFEGHAKGIEFCLESLIKIMEENENG